MTTFYTCGHEATFDEDDQHSNGSYAVWEEYGVDAGGGFVAQAYGSLCNKCIPVYRATKCKLGGEPL